ncbi:MAG: hypothetical protein E4H32_09485 [Nitrospirales bacterium]|nr:MAG: hypothetical protein E4H32_09485 [Nitrospirales bacterium]
MINKLGLASSLTLLLTFGCSTTSVQWYKAGVSQATFSHDKAECEKSLLGTGTTAYSKQAYTLEACMEAKGYRAIPASSQ